MAGEKMRKAVAAQPGGWLRCRPAGGCRRVAAAVGCGVVPRGADGRSGRRRARGGAVAADADVLVLVSHEGETALTLEAARAFAGPKWLVTAKRQGPIALH